MLISLDTSTASNEELMALRALIDSLALRGVLAAAVAGHDPGAPVKTDPRPAPPPPNASPNASSRDAAEALLQQEAARVAAQPQASDDDDAGPAVDPTTLDKEGIPWDARIHAGTKTQNKDGTWKKLRGVSEVLYGQVHAELQAKYAGNQATGTENNGAASQAGDTATAPDASNAPAPPPPGNAPPPPPETAPTAAEQTNAASASGAGRFADFPSFVQGVSAIRPGGIPYLELNQTANALGVGAFKDMKDHPDKWEMFFGMAGGQ